MSERSGVKEKGRLYFCVGLASSGKSTVCNKWLREYEQPPGEDWFSLLTFVALDGAPQKLELKCQPRVVIGGDDFRQALHGHEYQVESEGFVFASMDVAIRALLCRGFDVMVDETCTTQSTLLRYLKIDKDATPVFIDTPAEVCIERAKANGRDYLVGPITRMDEQLKALRADWDNVVAKLKGYVELRQGLDVAV